MYPGEPLRWDRSGRGQDQHGYSEKAGEQGHQNRSFTEDRPAEIIMESPEFQNIGTKIVLVSEAPLGADLAGAFRWEDFKRKGAPDFVMRYKDDVACIVYSSGTGGRPKGCVLTHENYLEQCRSLTAWYRARSPCTWQRSAAALVSLE